MTEVYEKTGNIVRQRNKYISENMGLKLLLTILAGCILIGFRLFGIPNDDVECLDDRVHDFLDPINRFLNENIHYANILIVSSSFCMDVASLSIFIYWLIYVRNTRFMMTIIVFYTFRMV